MKHRKSKWKRKYFIDERKRKKTLENSRDVIYHISFRFNFFTYLFGSYYYHTGVHAAMLYFLCLTYTNEIKLHQFFSTETVRAKDKRARKLEREKNVYWWRLYA